MFGIVCAMFRMMKKADNMKSIEGDEEEKSVTIVQSLNKEEFTGTASPVELFYCSKSSCDDIES